MKLSLLQMTQNILSALDSDDVNSISDTVESQQVAEIIKESYYELLSEREWPFLRTLIQLEGLADLSNPTKMRIPESVDKIYWIKYNDKEVIYLEPFDFKALIDNRSKSTDVTNADGYGTNADPSYYTSFDDDYVVFDSYNSAETDTLTASRVEAYGVTIPVWQAEDDFVPSLPIRAFPALLAEAKAACFVNLKQQANPREEKKARRGRAMLQGESWRLDKAEHLTNRKINYGR